MVLVKREFIGPYRLINVIRTTKASLIAEVMHDAHGRRLAVKLLQDEYCHDRQEVALLRHEYAVGKPLTHPRIIKFHDLHVAGDLAYLVMDYFPSLNLKQAIQEGVDRVAHQVEQIIRQSAEALGFFHDQGWVHRDVKPDNFLVNPQGEVKLIDFALAQKKKGGLARLLSGLSGKGKIQGTRSYLSPEQINGGALDQRSDMYSFGCVVHELIAGKPPFTAKTSNSLLTKHLKSPPPSLEAINDNVTRQFSQLVQRMLAKNPAQRPETMAAFLEEFGSLRAFVQRPQPPVDGQPAEASE